MVFLGQGPIRNAHNFFPRRIQRLRVCGIERTTSILVYIDRKNAQNLEKTLKKSYDLAHERAAPPTMSFTAVPPPDICTTGFIPPPRARAHLLYPARGRTGNAEFRSSTQHSRRILTARKSHDVARYCAISRCELTFW